MLRQLRGRPSDATCHLDLGDYFEGFGGVAWQWAGKNEAEARAALAARGERELVLQYVCDVHNLRHTDQAGGCSRSAVCSCPSQTRASTCPIATRS